MSDVRARAGLTRNPTTTRAAAPLPKTGKAIEVRSALNATVTVKLDPYDKNPLLTDARQSVPEVLAQAPREGLTPTLFGSGDLPPFTASGVDPRELLRLPWQIRHAAAAAPTRAAVYKLLESFTGTEAVTAAEMSPEAQTGANREYVQRFTRWLSGPTPE